MSREAPVLILKYDSTEIVPGGAGNAANNVAALGGARARSSASSAATRPAGGCSTALQPRASTSRRSCAPRGYRTPVEDAHPRRRHPFGEAAGRADRSRGDGRPSTTAIARAFATRLLRGARAAATRCSSRTTAPGWSRRRSSRARSALRGARAQPSPVLVDSRYALLDYRGLTACTPNESEVEQAARHPDRRRRARRSSAPAARCCDARAMRAVLITRGSRGMALFEPEQPTVHIPIFGSDEIADVTGAGDTVIATLTLALAAGASFDEAARLANYAGGLVVMKRGTATVSADELRRRGRRRIERLS